MILQSSTWHNEAARRTLAAFLAIDLRRAAESFSALALQCRTLQF
jgi:hypothetical protein